MPPAPATGTSGAAVAQAQFCGSIIANQGRIEILEAALAIWIWGPAQRQHKRGYHGGGQQAGVLCWLFEVQHTGGAVEVDPEEDRANQQI